MPFYYGYRGCCYSKSIGELGSLAEHAVNMGAKVPAWLPKILAAGKSAVDAAGDKIAGDDPKNENS